MSASDVPIVFTLSHLTRDANKARRVTWGRLDIPRNTMLIAIVSAVIGVVFMAMFWPLVGMYGFFFPVVIGVALYFGFETRSSTGMRRRRIQSQRDKMRFRGDVFYMRGVVVDPSKESVVTISTAWAPITNTPDAQDPVACYPLVWHDG